MGIVNPQLLLPKLVNTLQAQLLPIIMVYNLEPHILPFFTARQIAWYGMFDKTYLCSICGLSTNIAIVLLNRPLIRPKQKGFNG